MTFQPRFEAAQDELERLLHYMPVIAEKSERQWPRDFAHSMMLKSKRRSWNPSPKQLSMMRRLVSDLFAHGYEGGELDVIED